MSDPNLSHMREQQYNVILNRSPNMIAYLDEHERFRFANDKYCRIHSKTADRIVGYSINEVLGDDLVASIRDRIDAVLAGEEQRFESKVRNEKGEERWVEAYYVPEISSDNKIRGFFAFIVDIHDRKITEQSLTRFKYAIDQGAEGFALHDAAGNFTYINQAQAALYGYDAAEVLGRSWSIFYDQEQTEEIETVHFPRLMKEGKWHGELIGMKKSGEKFDIEVSLTLLKDDAGNPSGLVCNCQDITQRKIAEQSLRQLQKMDAIGQLTSGIAHDFNNMLAVIQGNAELLEDEIGEGNTKLAAVFHGTERAADLTQRMLAFSRKQVLRPEVINIDRLAKTTTGLLHRVLEEHIEIETVTSAGLWNCEVDPAQLETALLNLVINARDAMPDGGKLTIETANVRLDDEYAAGQAETRPGQYVLLAVADNGFGMPPEVRERVFEPFFTTKGVGKGSGLGLSMVYGFVKQSGGNVTIYSEPGEGTTIKLYLPRSTETKAVERKASTDKVPMARGETVFVVEDDPDVRTLVVAQLSSLGYQIMEAETGMAALEQLGTLPLPNLLLTDVVLRGDMNGRELAVEVKRRIPEIQVLYMSGYTENGIVHHGRLDTDSALLQKPFRKADLARAVRRALDGPSV